MDQNDFRYDSERELVPEPVAQDLIAWAREQLAVHQPRDDYKEMLELAIIILGGDLERKLKFKLPGALHHARWMSKPLYLMKLYMFRDQLILLDEELAQIVKFFEILLEGLPQNLVHSTTGYSSSSK